MGFLFFILTIVFFVLWMSSSSARKRDTDTSYKRGYEAGRQDVLTALEKGAHKGAVTKATLRKYAEEAVPAAEPIVAPTETVLFPGERGADEAPDAQAALAPEVHVELVPDVIIPAQTRAEQTNRNLNILLYAASFLIIAAAAAFIATSMPASVRLVSLWAVILVFYGVGLLLHAKVSYLRSAATAFVGTGLALIPFAGIALSQLGGVPAGWAWAITSFIGVLCYAIATIRLSSNVVAYLTIAFSLSFATSCVAVISAPFVLYFVILIAVSLIFHILAQFKSDWIPSVFQRPIEQTGHLLTPLTLLASLFAYDRMTLTSYEIVFWVSTVYYAVLWATERKYVYELSVRILASIAVIITFLDLVDFNLTSGLWAWVVVLALQGIYSLLRIRVGDKSSRLAETAWYWSIIGLAVISLTYWAGSETVRLGVTAQVGLILLLSTAMTLRLRVIYVAIPALFASAALPFLLGRWPGEEVLSISALTYVFIAMAAAALGWYYLWRQRSLEVRGFLQAMFLVYLVIAFLASMFQGTAVAFALSLAVIGLLVLVASYVYRQWELESGAVVAVPPIIGILLAESSFPDEGVILATIAISALLFVGGAIAHQFAGEEKRRNLLVVAALVVGFGLVLGMMNGSEHVQIASALFAVFYALLALVLRLLASDPFIKSALLVAYVSYPIVALLAAVGLDAGWYALILAVTTFIYWYAVHAEKSDAFLVFGNITFALTVYAAWIWLELGELWVLFGISWIVAAVYYLMYLYFMKSEQPNRWLAQLVFTWVALGIPILVSFWDGGEKGYAAAITLAVAAATLVIHGGFTGRKSLIESGVYVGTLAVQRIVGLSFPEIEGIVYAHWWALVLGVVAYWRRNEAHVVLRIVLAVAAITASSGLSALIYGGGYQLLFLVEHVALLVIGALTRTSWALWWGLSATVVAVLYFLRDSLFLALLFLGLTLLSIVIWRLIRTQRKK